MYRIINSKSAMLNKLVPTVQSSYLGNSSGAVDVIIQAQFLRSLCLLLLLRLLISQYFVFAHNIFVLRGLFVGDCKGCIPILETNTASNLQSLVSPGRQIKFNYLHLLNIRSKSYISN